MTPQDERCASTLRAVRRWVAADRIPVESDGLALARSVNDHVRRTGKHFLPQRMLLRLSEIRRRDAADLPFLHAFLDCLLDKHEGRFWNRTYLSLPILELLLDERNSGVSADRMSTLLMADVVRFEAGAAGGSREGPGRGRPDAETVSTRLRHALRFVARGVGGSAAEDLPSRLDDTSGARIEELVDHLPRPPATDAWAWFDVTVQPVYVLHDEYFFIRILQAHEMLFTAMAGHVRSAVAALREGNPEKGAERIDDAVAMFERAAGLFRTVATMRAEHFSAFRHYTQGASAIQSEQYKRFESLCGVPRTPRLHSTAFTSVPAVRAEAQAPGHDTVARAYLDLRRERGPGGAAWGRLDAALGRLESRHQRWKSAHRGLAARMLGNAHGSGYTDGVPYLTGALDNRLFWQLPLSR
ncbi:MULTISPECIES: tryptophan 2,3-dioxygenase family protein [unclassified Streptomyces]|uniref:tryptophan 2,3-dioxygenase family protein n=1 Tax=unclassified Streptomyces TaxID=2593676 RepID=UPI000756784F|nr:MULTISPECIES: tryptophan 2,3-dioxygenase family protein [unclassified Streptomyces]